MDDRIHVMIIEDDFRIAAINSKYVERQAGFAVQYCAKTGEEALRFLSECAHRPDLILLDIYIPDTEGLDLFWQLRTAYRDIDLIIVSAAAEAKTIEAALRGGIFDYIIKPADVERFAQTLTRYRQQRELLASRELLTQAEADTLTGGKPAAASSDEYNEILPKGIDPITLDEVTRLLQTRVAEGITAVDLSGKIGTSRSTARRYLEYLVSVKKVRATLKYGTVGRPERKYEYVEE
jgi:response regulator of citrate/malate metabolism